MRVADVRPVSGPGGPDRRAPELCTHLPIIRVDTGDQTIPGRPYAGVDGNTAGYLTGDNGEEEILVQFSTVSAEGVWHHQDDPADAGGSALFRYRGNSSRWFTKGNFLLKTVKDGDPLDDRRMELLGMNSGKEWALHGPFLDKTLMRNYMCMNLSAEVMETIAVDPNRLNLREYEPGDPVFSYLVRIEPYTNPEKVLDNFSLYSYRMEPWRRLELLYPGTANQTRRVREYVQVDYSEVERMLYSVEMLDGSDSWRQELDMDSFVNYYIIMEFFGINDTFAASTYFYRDVRGKLAIGPVWDYNNALGNFLRPISSREFLLSQRGWYAKLMQDEDFVERVISRYRQRRRCCCWSWESGSICPYSMAAFICGLERGTGLPSPFGRKASRSSAGTGKAMTPCSCVGWTYPPPFRSTTPPPTPPRRRTISAG